MTWAPKGPFGSVVHGETTVTCEGCGYSIRSDDPALLDGWLNQHDCNDPEAWEPPDS